MSQSRHRPGNDQLQALLEGLLPDSGHLDHCPACRERLSAFRLLFDDLDRLEQGPGPEPGPEFSTRVMAVIRGS